MRGVLKWSQGHDPDAAKFLIKPDDSLLSLTRLISQNDVVTLRDVKMSSPPRTDATCFHTVLAGSGHLQVRPRTAQPSLAAQASYTSTLACYSACPQQLAGLDQECPW